jgi:hypothetical protein
LSYFLWERDRDGEEDGEGMEIKMGREMEDGERRRRR